MLSKSILNPLLLLSVLSSTIYADKDFFMGVNSGYNNLKADKTANLVTNTIDEKGYNVVMELGYNLSKSITISLNYQRVKNDSTSLDNYYLASEYTLTNYKSFSPYIGLNLGLSELTWEKVPVNLINKDLYSSSYMLGTTIGSTYKLDKDFFLNFNYTLNYMDDHITTIKSTSQNGEIKHKLSHGFNLGVRYCF